MEIVGVDLPPAVFDENAAKIVALAESWEGKLSRFRPESALCRLNAAAGTGPVVTDTLVFDLVDSALEMNRRSSGYFNPLILPALEGAGYIRDFPTIESEVPVSGPELVSGSAAVLLEPELGTIALSAGARLDLGGIAKGAFLDAVFALVGDSWPGGCIDAGGDLRVWGRSPSGDHWRIGLEDPFDPSRDLAQVLILDPVRAGAVATSGRNRRRWCTADGSAHHLIDPISGLPAVGAVETATVFAPSGLAADVAAKALFLSISRREPPLLVDASFGITIDEHGAGLAWSTTDELVLRIVSAVVRTS
jgi:thiamine biosynthesis lipoprotein